MSSKISQKNKLALMQLATKIYTPNTPHGLGSINQVSKYYKKLVKLFNKS